MKRVILVIGICCALSTFVYAQRGAPLQTTSAMKGALQYSLSAKISPEKTVTIDYWSLIFGPVTFDAIMAGRSSNKWAVCDLTTASDLTVGDRTLKAGTYKLSIKAAGENKLELYFLQEQEEQLVMPIEVTANDDTHERLAIKLMQAKTGNCIDMVMFYGDHKSRISLFH